jgi:hypothetical protein
VEKDPNIQLGGSIDRAINGQYTINVTDVLKQAWQQTVISRASINGGLALSLLIGIIVTLITSQFLGGIEVAFKDQQSSLLLNIVITLIISPFLGGVEMMGVFHAAGLKSESKFIFYFLKRGSWVALCALLSSMIVTMGMSLFYVPGIFLAVGMSLSIPLVIEKKMTPMKALFLSVQATRYQWFKIFTLYLILLFALIISLVPLIAFSQSNLLIIPIVLFVFSLSYLAPMYYNVKGILYMEIFGMQVDANSSVQNDVFSA